MGVESLGRAVLDGSRIVAPGLRPADFASPQPIAHVKRPETGAVLFLVWDEKHGFYRSLCELYAKEPDGSWWDKSQWGVAWPWVDLSRPSELGNDRVEFSGRSVEIGENKLTYLLPGVAATDVQQIRCEHADGRAPCPIEHTTGAFICLGELTAERRTVTIEVTTNDGAHCVTETLLDVTQSQRTNA
jgi:hypothetical protein